jgi:riboflavin kinase / FMN adenylyltransferase
MRKTVVQWAIPRRNTFATIRMNLLLEPFQIAPEAVLRGAVTVGNFDGVHRGHQAIIEQVRRLADEVHGPAIVFTFDPPPARLLRPKDAPEALTVMERRSALLTKLGVDIVVVFKTTSALLNLEPEQFFEQIMVHQLQCQAIAEGENFRFGKERRGDISLLKRLCDLHRIRFSLLELQRDDGDWISSTRIRSFIETGNIAAANKLLWEPYRVSGLVGHGAKRGRTLGFPTANLENIPVLCPPPGVYAGRVASIHRPSHRSSAEIAEAPIGYPVAIHIGPNPTFGENGVKFEAHIVGYDGNLYDCELGIEMLERLRNVCKFDSKDQLLAQLALDVERATQIAQALAGQLP